MSIRKLLTTGNRPVTQGRALLVKVNLLSKDLGHRVQKQGLLLLCGGPLGFGRLNADLDKIYVVAKRSLLGLVGIGSGRSRVSSNRVRCFCRRLVTVPNFSIRPPMKLSIV